MGLFSLIGGIIGGSGNKKASRKAEAAQIAANNAAIAEQRRQYDQSRTDFMPYLTAGTGALGGISDLTGLNGGAKQGTAIDALKASPFYQSLYGTGEEAVLQNASATGGIRGGNTQTGLADFGRDTLMQTIQQQLSNLGGIASMGEGATNQIAGYGANASNNVSGLLNNQGGIHAGGLMYRAGINAQNWNNVGAFADQAASAIAGGGVIPGVGGAGGAGSGLFKMLGF